MDTKTRRSKCPINFAVEIFGDKWTLLIVRDMVLRGQTSYGDFLDSYEKISTNILADRLSKLEQEGMVHKSRDEQHGAKCVYTPTEKMLDLLPVMLEMILWSAKHNTDSVVPDSMVDQIRENRTKVIEDILDSLEHR